MKNIHMLPTDKPSDLLLCIKDYTEHKYTHAENSDNKGNLRLGYGKYANTEFYQPQYIYITSDEEIKEGDWFITKGEVFKCTLSDEFIWRNNFDKFPCMKIDCKKIILTTDQSLDGVQAIDDDFLEWFVKNPSCEEVEVDRWNIRTKDKVVYEPSLKEYKIIIPQEEPKSHSFCETPEEKCTMNYCDENGCQNRVRYLVEPQEEAAEKYARNQCDDMYDNIAPSGGSWGWETKIDFIAGAKWQQKQCEILFDEYHEYTVDCIEVELKRPLPFKKWLEKFKNK